jgi:hypothetical protein
LQPHLQLEKVSVATIFATKKVNLQGHLQLEKKSQLQLHLELQNKILIATALATEKYFITEENLSCNHMHLQLEKQISVAIEKKNYNHIYK